MKKQMGNKYRHGKVYGFLVIEDEMPIYFDVWTLEEWHSVCMTVGSNGLHLYIDNVLTVNMNQYRNNLTQGNVQLFKSLSNSHHMVNTEVTDLNVWNDAKSSDFIRKWSECSNYMEQGNLVNWSSEHIKTQLEFYEESLDNICKKEHLTVAFPGKLNFNRTIDNCHRIGAQMAVASDEKALEVMVSAVENLDVCKQEGFFVGYSDREDEGVWVNVHDGSHMNFSKWADGQPNNFNKIEEDCAVYSLHEQKMRDKFCYSLYCPLCEMKTRKTFELDRVCLDSLMNIDTHYVMINSSLFIGLMYSKLIKNQQLWELRSLEDDSLIASMQSQIILETGFLAGTEEWKFVNNSCHDRGNETRQMNFHLVVDRPGYFCCTHGKCIESNLVCNEEFDCYDGSDEENCLHRFVKSDSTEGDKISPKTIEVNVDVTIAQVIDISQDKNTFSLFFWLRMTWTNPNRNFLFLNEDHTLNVPSKMSSNEKFWEPKIHFYHLHGGDSFQPMKESLFIRRKGEPTLIEMDDYLRYLNIGWENVY